MGAQKELNDLIAEARKAQEAYDQVARDASNAIRDGAPHHLYELQTLAEVHYQAYQNTLVQIGLYCLLHQQNVMERRIP